MPRHSTHGENRPPKISRDAALDEMQRLIRTIDENLRSLNTLSWDHTGGRDGLDEEAFDAQIDAAQEHFWNAVDAFDAWSNRPPTLDAS